MTFRSRRSWLTRTAALGAAIGLPAQVLAQASAWPTQPIRIIVTFPPGGASDIVARLIGPVMGDRLGQPVVVENRPGAGSTIGAAVAAQARPDGYTLLASNSAPMSISPALMAKPTYDPLRSFEHLAYIGAVPTVIVLHPSVPATSFQQFLSWARAQPEPIPFGSGGTASVGHIVGELLARQTGIRLLHVPYKGAGPMRTDLLGGQLKMAVDALPQNLPLMKSGKLKLVAVTSEARVAMAPDLPSVAELGLPELVAENFVGLSAPAGLPGPIAARVIDAVHYALDQASLREKLLEQGFVLERKSPAAFTEFIRSQAERWAPVVRASGAQL
jgi:tripartite-type tricarboxylate transporter receptor subunit TctC